MLIGPAEERWDLAFIAEYPGVAAFVAMIRDPVYREAVKHRQAAVEDLRLIRLKPGAAGVRIRLRRIPPGQARVNAEMFERHRSRLRQRSYG